MNNKTVISYSFSKFDEEFEDMTLVCKGNNAEEISRYISAIIKDESEERLILIPNHHNEDNEVTSEGILHYDMSKEQAIKLFNLAIYYVKMDYKDCCISLI